MAWYLAPSLVALREEANARHPNRDKTSDGSVGDTSHAARKSDHNPDYESGGIVRAYDLDEDLNGNKANDAADLMVLVNAIVTRRDPRVAYLIYEGRIWRSYDKPGIPAWTPSTYTGVNKHTQHLHVSIKHTQFAETDRSPWFTGGKVPTGGFLMALSDKQQDEVYEFVRQIRTSVVPYAQDAQPSDARFQVQQLVKRVVPEPITEDRVREIVAEAVATVTGPDAEDIKEWVRLGVNAASRDKPRTTLGGKLKVITDAVTSE